MADDPIAAGSDPVVSDEERCHIECRLHDRLSQAVWDHSRLPLGEFTFTVLGEEEGKLLGFDDMAVLLRRESDGTLFEIEIDVTARRIDQDAPGGVPGDR